MIKNFGNLNTLQLDKEDPSILKEDLKLTSAWIAELIMSLTKKQKK